MIALALKSLGLMRVSEHEALLADAKADVAWHESVAHGYSIQLADVTAKFKRAATDLAAQAEETDRLRAELGAEALAIAGLHNEIMALRPDAQKWRDYLKRSRDRKAGRKA